MINWLNPNERLQVIESLSSDENKRRKRESLIAFEVYNDRIYGYVYNYLLQQMGKKTVDSMPIVSTVNLCKRIIDKQASIYKKPVKREFQDVSEETAAILNDVYEPFDAKMQRVNTFFKLQNQALIYVRISGGHILPRVVMPHQYDAIPSDDDPEIAQAYILSAFDKSEILPSDKVNEKHGDRDDYQSILQKYIVWTPEYHFVMDGRGNIIDAPFEDLRNPYGDMMPFVDVATEKDYEYYIRQGDTSVDFTVQYNAALSDTQNIIRLQGYAQAVYKGPVNLLPEVIHMGPNVVIRLPTDPNNPDADTDFDFKNPSPDIMGTLKAQEMLLANYISSRGIDTKIITGQLGDGVKYSSGYERMLAMLDQFEATQEDFNLFQQAEQKLFKVVKRILSTYSRTDVLEKEYWVTPEIENAELHVKFYSPEMVQSEAEKIANAQAKIELGIDDEVGALMSLEGMSEDQAIQKLDKLRQRERASIAASALLVNRTEMVDDGQDSESEAE